MTAIAGGTVSQLSGGKFANGAVSSAFVWMFNEMEHDRLSQLKKIAKSIISDSNVDLKLRNRLASVLAQNKLYYTDSTDGPEGWKEGVYRGYSRSGNRIYLTSALWEKNGELNIFQATDTIIHEVAHKVLPGTSNHPKYFTDYRIKQTQNYFIGDADGILF